MTYREAVIDAVTSRFGVAIKFIKRTGPYFTWDPKQKVLSFTPEQSLYSILHEVSHYITASKKERTYPEFGLGTDTEFGRKRTRRRMTLTTRDLREEITVCVHAFLYHWLWHKLPEHREDLESHLVQYVGMVTEGDRDSQAKQRLKRFGVTEEEWKFYWDDEVFYPEMHDLAASTRDLRWQKTRLLDTQRYLDRQVADYASTLESINRARAKLHNKELK